MRHPTSLLGAFVLMTTASCGAGRATGEPVEPSRPPVVALDAVPTELPGEPIAEDLLARLGRTRLRAASLRRLPWHAEVPVRRMTGPELARYALDHDDPARLDERILRYQALGLIGSRESIQSLLRDAASQQIVALYSPRDRCVVVRDTELDRWVGGHAPEVEGTLVHELVHALQHQHFPHAFDPRPSTDAENARVALLEGDASLVTMALGMGRPLRYATMHWSALSEALAANRAHAANALATWPPILATPLVSRYFDGLTYVAWAHARGDFAGVDALFTSLPTSMLLLADPRHAHGVPAPLEFPDSLPPGSIPDDTLGPVEVAVALPELGERTLSEWDGDRLRVTATGNSLHAVWRLRVRHHETARELVEALEQRGFQATLEGLELRLAVTRAHPDRPTTTE